MFAYKPSGGEVRQLRSEQPSADEVRIWLVHDGSELKRCFSCGGRDTITPVRADAEAAQTVVADAFYRTLPPASARSRSDHALDYPGKGRKLLTFSDSRQSAAYFAPYLENSNLEQRLRRLMYRALRSAEERLPEVDADSLVSHMVRLAEEEDHFVFSLPRGKREEACKRAVVAEFCLPFSRRQSLEALALAACAVRLKGRWAPPETILPYLEPLELETAAQVLLATVRLLRAVEMPVPISDDDPAFKYQTGKHLMMASGSQQQSGRYRLYGFSPERAPHLQRRASFMSRVLESAALRRGIDPPPTSKIRSFLDDIWKGLLHANRPVLKDCSAGRGIVGHQLRWEDLWFRSDVAWYFCAHCQQWSAFNVLGVCPSFQCGGRLEEADPNVRLEGNHYRRIYSHPADGPVPLIAREHTAQLGPKLATAYQAAFQDGHHPDEGQINVLSSSTTFELGVDLGDLEAVFLRNVPPSAANYQQRAGRAGRGIGSAAFAVTFAMPRSHDEHFFAQPPLMIDGLVRPPHIDLGNETLFLRHLHAVLIAEFARAWADRTGTSLKTIGQILAPIAGATSTPLDDFLEDLPTTLQANTRAQDVLLPGGHSAWPVNNLCRIIRREFLRASEYFSEEVTMYEEAIKEIEERQRVAESQKNRELARKLYSFRGFLQERLDGLFDTDWVSFFSDRTVLPSYAFPIYNVNLATPDRDLKLERDLRIALSEYVPGAAIVAKGRLWRSVGVRFPFRKSLERKYYSRCPHCWHVMRHLKQNEVFPDGICPVCKHDGVHPRRMVHCYLVPEYGFTTDLTVQGEDLSFDRPMRIQASRVMFVPQQQADDPVRLELGSGTLRIEVRTTEKADFFVFNDGEDPSGLGFPLCKACGRTIEFEGKKRAKVRAHNSPYGKNCSCDKYDLLHLGHDFISCAARLTFTGTNQGFEQKEFWLSLLYALLHGMADALGIEAGDINGVIRPVNVGGGVAQEVVVFDDVPGGAGHALRLENQDELLRVLQAAHARVANCTCGETASCYTCLRSYRNQFCHDQLSRGPVIAYLERLLEVVTANPDDDRPYVLPDRSSALRTAIRECARLDLIVDGLTDSGPQEAGPWYVHLLEAAAKAGSDVRVAITRPVPSDVATNSAAHLMALVQAGIRLCRTKKNHSLPPYGLLAMTQPGGTYHRSVAYHWGPDQRVTTFDGETHLRPMWYNRSPGRLAEVQSAMDDWFNRYAEPITLRDLIANGNGYRVHAVKKGQVVDFRQVFGTVEGKKIESAELQDPYLLSQHQVKCLDDFLQSVSWQPANSTVSFRLITQLSDGDPSKRDQLTPTKQKEEITARLAKVASLSPKVDYRYRRYSPLHMRYVWFRLEGARQVLYLLERGLDMEDPRTGKARADTFVLEFSEVPASLRGLLGI